MAVQMGIMIGIEVADAEHNYDSLLKHWLACVKVGVTEAEKRAYASLI